MKECRSATDTQRTKLKDRKEFAKMKRGFSHGHMKRILSVQRDKQVDTNIFTACQIGAFLKSVTTAYVWFHRFLLVEQLYLFRLDIHRYETEFCFCSVTKI